MSDQAPAGWYPPDASRPHEVQYWDGQRWTEFAESTEPPRFASARPAGATAARSRQSTLPRWLVSWPAILIGLVLCILPGLALLWLRPQSSRRTKSLITAGVAGFVVWAVATAPEPAPVDETIGSPVATPSDSARLATTRPSSSPTPTASTKTPARKPAGGTALAAVASLKVKGRAAKTGYERAQFGSGWIDVDRNGCDTRNDMLQATLTDRTMSGPCKVLAGTLDDPYTRASVRFVYGGADEVDVDHVVALEDAWQKGASSWPFAKRVAFANDPLNLQPTDARANRQKGAGDAATWLPPNKAYRCTYVARQVAVKAKYQLWVTAAERDAMIRVLATCPDHQLPGPGPQPTIAVNTGG